jgi:hypothetical protein
LNFQLTSSPLDNAGISSEFPEGSVTEANDDVGFDSLDVSVDLFCPMFNLLARNVKGFIEVEFFDLIPRRLMVADVG